MEARCNGLDLVKIAQHIAQKCGVVMPPVETNARKIVARLKAEGWQDAGGSKHDKFDHPDHQETIIVPRHKELSPGVARSIAKLAGWS